MKLNRKKPMPHTAPLPGPKTLPRKKRAITKRSKKRLPKPKLTPKHAEHLKRLTKRTLHTNKPEFFKQRSFKNLRKSWYDKLKKAGFKDLEHINSERMQGQSLNDKRFQSRIEQFSSMTSHDFTRWTCFLAWNQNGKLTELEKIVIGMWGNGKTIQEIRQHLKTIKKYNDMNTFRLYYFIERLKVVVDDWNKKHPEGMDYKADIGGS